MASITQELRQEKRCRDFGEPVIETLLGRCSMGMCSREDCPMGDTTGRWIEAGQNNWKQAETPVVPSHQVTQATIITISSKSVDSEVAAETFKFYEAGPGWHPWSD
ncbi:hypothetical protein SELMODRAFT_409236 [Selaginella moellendorffii]|uniref:Uncharacterized protein n=1 Tax=Selaginella moellendorffii TaxID=88036 RepID=D8RAT6_SELML|nr:hypothetical protein SELMODRAFT_409236 [Selaginella moellendorffii]